MPPKEWDKRAFDPVEDQNVVVSQWCTSYMRGREGVSRGAFLPKARASETQFLEEVRKASIEMWAEQEPLVRALLASPAVTVEVICDPERTHRTDAGPAVVWAFAATSGDVVHYVSVKRKVALVLGPELVRDLLGDRLERACTFTHELVEMRNSSCGVKLPLTWVWANSLVLPRMIAQMRVGPRRAA